MKCEICRNEARYFITLTNSKGQIKGFHTCETCKDLLVKHAEYSLSDIKDYSVSELYIEPDITNKEKDILKYIIRFKEVNGYSPTVREIANGTYNSIARVHSVMEKLQDMNYIRFKAKSPRTINVLKFIS